MARWPGGTYKPFSTRLVFSLGFESLHAYQQSPLSPAAEASDLKSLQGQFESDRGYQ